MGKMSFPRLNEGDEFKYDPYSSQIFLGEQQSIEIVFIEKFFMIILVSRHSRMTHLPYALFAVHITLG